MRPTWAYLAALHFPVPATDLLVQQHQEVAASLAATAKARMSQISPCDLTADSGTTCALSSSPSLASAPTGAR